MNKRELDRALAYIEAVERGENRCTSHDRASSVVRISAMLKPGGPGRSTAGIRGSTPVPSPPSRANRPTATLSISYSHTGNFVARGLYNSRSKIRVRLYSWSPDSRSGRRLLPRPPGRPPSALRGSVLGLDGPGRACRLVFSEGDGLSGLTVDRYDRWLVVQFTALALAQRRDMLAELLVELAAAGRDLSAHRARHRPAGGPGAAGRSAVGPGSRRTSRHRGRRACASCVNLAEGQKTGFYLDQRDNRLAVARLAAGRRVLDAFCYTGGFGLHAARAGARAVLGVDVSEPALALGRAKCAAQWFGRACTFVRRDVFDQLQTLAAAGRALRPGRARSAEVCRGAQRGRGSAARLPAAADVWPCACLEPDGILVTCCCSGLITVVMLEDLLGPAGGRGTARDSDSRTPRAGPGSSGLGGLSGIALPEMPHQPRRPAELKPAADERGSRT